MLFHFETVSETDTAEIALYHIAILSQMQLIVQPYIKKIDDQYQPPKTCACLLKTELKTRPHALKCSTSHCIHRLKVNHI